MNKVRLSASMSTLIQEEKSFVEQWLRCLPRRRQQWLREQTYLAIESGSEVVSYRKESSQENSEDAERTVRIQIELDVRDNRDKAVYDIYQSMSKSRRGQWLRNALILGCNISSGGKLEIAKICSPNETKVEIPTIRKSNEDESIKGVKLDDALATKDGAKDTVIESSIAASPASEKLGISTSSEPIPDENKSSDNQSKPIHASELRNLFSYE